MAIKWLGKIIGWKNKVAGKPKGVSSGAQAEGCVSDKIVPLPEPKDLGELVRMMERDYQVQFMKYIITANVAAVRVSVSVDGVEDQKSKGIAKKIEELWQKSVGSMMNSFGYGRQAFEKTFDFDASVPCTFVKRLEPIEFEDSTLRLTEDHKYDGFEVRINGPDDPEKWVPIKAADSEDSCCIPAP